jgi:CheY-like chemotaxis protein
MLKPAPHKQPRKILLAESDVIVRLGLSQHLRACAHVVLEAADADEAKAILHAEQSCDVLICDPQLAGSDSGFAIAQWVRRHHSKTKVVLAATLQAKTLAVVELCGSSPNAAPQDASALSDAIRIMRAERTRRSRRQAPTAGGSLRRKQMLF